MLTKDSAINLLNKYYVPLVEIKDYNALIIQKEHGHTTGNLLDYLYYQNYYKFIGIDLSGQTNMTITQQINFT